MAEPTLPVPTPAPDGNAPNPTLQPSATPPVPAPTPADTQPTGQPTLTLSDDQKSYLKGQGLSDADLASPDALAKIISHAQSSQRTAADIKNQLDKVTSVVTPQPTQPVNPLVNPVASSQPQPGDAPQAPQGGLDPLMAFTLTSQLVGNFPELKDDLTTGKFYSDMQAKGIPLQANGQVNLDGLLAYGKFAQEQAQLAARLEEMNKPGEGAIPDANPTTPQQPAADAPMTKQMALAISQHVAKGNTHARSAEAQQFLQKSV